MPRIVWDTENDQEANNWDGSKPKIKKEQIFIREFSCNCSPAGSGGVVTLTIKDIRKVVREYNKEKKTQEGT